MVVTIVNTAKINPLTKSAVIMRHVHIDLGIRVQWKLKKNI